MGVMLIDGSQEHCVFQHLGPVNIFMELGSWSLGAMQGISGFSGIRGTIGYSQRL
jgi:hypothetical protein